MENPFSKVEAEELIEGPDMERLLDLAGEDLLEEVPDEKAFKKKKWKVFKSLQLAVVASVLGFVGNHMYQFRDKTDVPTDAAGTEWKHSDKETEHLLNVFSGKENFTESEKEYLARHMTVGWCKKWRIPVPKGVEQWKMSDVEKFYLSLSVNENPARRHDLKQLDYIQQVVNGQPYFMKRVHQELWKIEKNSGSPYVRWQDQKHSVLSEKEHRAHHNPLLNTIYIAPEDLESNLYDQFLAEASHATQFKGSPVSSYARGARDVARVVAGSIFSRNGLEDEWQKLYDEKGTLEHEAHSEIEPNLQKKVDSARVQDDTQKFGRFAQY